MKYKGTILGFDYNIEKNTDEEFKIWLKAKLERYVLIKGDPVVDVLLDVLGIKELKDKVATLEQV